MNSSEDTHKENNSLVMLVSSLQSIDKEISLKVIDHANAILAHKANITNKELEIIKNQQNQVNYEYNLAKRAQNIALTISMTSLIGGVGVVYLGHDWAGALIAATGAGLVGAGQLLQMAKKLTNRKFLEEGQATQTP